MRDSIYITGLKVSARIGVYDWEKKVEQLLYVDLDLLVDLKPPGLSDNLEDTLNYADIAEQVQTHALAKHYQLLEHFAETFSAELLKDKRIQQVRIRVNKPAAIPHAEKIGVKLCRMQTE